MIPEIIEIAVVFHPVRFSHTFPNTFLEAIECLLDFSDVGIDAGNIV